MTNTAYTCSDLVYRAEVKRSLEHETDAMVLAYERKFLRNGRSRTMVKGFALLDLTSRRNDLYVTLICARGVGSKILRKVFRYAKKNRKKRVTLNALPHVINYYRKFGFRFAQQGCDESVSLEKAAQKVSHRRFRKHVNKRKERVNEIVHAQTDPTYRRFLKKLIRGGFAKPKGCTNVYNCDYGYFMARCLDQ